MSGVEILDKRGMPSRAEVCLILCQGVQALLPRLRSSQRWSAFLWIFTSILKVPKIGFFLLLFFLLGPGLILTMLTGLSGGISIPLTLAPMIGFCAWYSHTHYQRSPLSENLHDELQQRLRELNGELARLKDLNIATDWQEFGTVDQLQRDLEKLVSTLELVR
jgi:hypothetical protein